MAKKRPIDASRDAALAALMTAGTFTEAAEIAGVSRKTLYNYIHGDMSFVTAYRDLRRAQMREAAEKVRGLEDKATDFMSGLIDDDRAPPQVRLAAAVKLLELADRYRSIEAQINHNTIDDKGGLFDSNKPSAV
ncbi:MAG: helix-turn-helix domain-containing protein [Treponema sp.]|nr:helix-turn-helix domain-containing protein [Treponema sp.]